MLNVTGRVCGFTLSPCSVCTAQGNLWRRSRNQPYWLRRAAEGEIWGTGLWWPLRSDRVHPACFLAGRRSIQQWGRHLACGPAVLPIFCRAPLVPGPGKFREDQCPTELGRRAACQRRRQRTSWPALRPLQSGPIPWASGAGLCSLPSPASGKRGTRRQSIHSGGPESPSSLGAGPGVSPGENLCPEWGSRCWAVC